ncbi:MAG: 5'/3'-nucleotidase SurE, partial [Elusimicrobiota bacterium]
MSRSRILVVNDDGWNGSGLHPLIEALSRLGRVCVVVPERERSAESHCLTLHKPLRASRHPSMEKDNIKVYSTNGTPSDSVMLGLLEIAQDTDVLFSGINGGPNMGEDVLYSGTAAAAMEGALLGVRSIAI